MMFVYQIFCIRDGKTYIGITNDLRHRWNEHRRLASKGAAKVLYQAMRDDGIESFEFRLLHECNSVQAAHEAEKYWIKFFDAQNPAYGYNRTAGGQGTYAVQRDAVWRERQRLAQTGKRLSPDTIQKIRLANSKERHPMYGKTGSNHQASKLTQNDVLLVKQLISEGFSDKEIAKFFKVNPHLIWQIKRGKRQ